VFRGDSEINNGFSKWHSSEAIKKCHPSVLRGDSEVIGKRKNKKTIATFQWLSREEPGGSFV